MAHEDRIRVRVTVSDAEAGPSPAPRWTAAESARLWTAALSASPRFVVTGDQRAVHLAFTDPRSLGVVPPGAAAMVSWPRDSARPVGLDRLQGVVVPSAGAAAAMAEGAVPVVHLPMPWEPQPPRGGGGDRLGFTGWLFDTRGHAGPCRGVQLESGTLTFTVVADADDADRGWADAIYAFAEACGASADRTLLVWMAHRDQSAGPAVALDVMSRLEPRSCRILVAVGRMSPSEYCALISRTDVFIAAPDAEAGERSLVEFAAAGVPAIGPPKSYPDVLSSRTGILASSYSESVASWVSPEPRMTAIREVYDWASLRTAIGTASRSGPGRLRELGLAGSQRTMDVHSPDRAVQGLQDFLRSTNPMAGRRRPAPP